MPPSSAFCSVQAYLEDALYVVAGGGNALVGRRQHRHTRALDVAA